MTKERAWGPREILTYWRSRERVLPLRMTPDNVAVLTVHWSVVPGYDYASVTQGQSDEDIRREVEIDWSATTGLRIYPQFNRQIHVASQPLTFDPRATLYCGWDFGGTPAFIPTQLNGYGQWLIFPPLAPPETETLGTYEFAEMVQHFLHSDFAEPHDLTVDRLKLVHYGDPAGAAPPAHTGDRPREMRSHFDIIRRGVEIVMGHDDQGRALVTRKPGFGWFIKPGAVDITTRLESVRARLTKLTPNGYPALVVDPAANEIIEGFGGGYCRRQRADGRYDHDPYKNFYSHVFDALGYVATRLFHRVRENEELDDDERPQRHIVVSHAAGRNH